MIQKPRKGNLTLFCYIKNYTIKKTSVEKKEGLDEGR